MKVGDIVMVQATTEAERYTVPGLIVEPDHPDPAWWLVRIATGWVSVKRENTTPRIRPATCADLRAFGVRREHDAGREGNEATNLSSDGVY